MLRLAVVDGIAHTDPAGLLPGRGAYACGRPCLERLQDRRSLSRAFRAPVARRPTAGSAGPGACRALD